MKDDDQKIQIQWRELPKSRREKICKDHGFGDWKTYASYRWTDFQPHTREQLKDRVKLESDAASGFDQTPTNVIIERLRDLESPTALQAAERLKTLEKQLAEIRHTLPEPFTK